MLKMMPNAVLVALLRLAIVGAMNFSWIFIGLFALSACQSGTTAPEGEESPAEPESAAAAAAEEATPSTEPASAEEPPAVAPDTPAPAEVAAPVVEPDPNAPRDVAAPPKSAKRSKSGLAWKVSKKGKGKAHPGKFDTVTMNYTGWTSEGRMFDSTERQGQSMVIPLNRLIYGVTEGVQMMTAGEKRRLWVPGDVAYGEKTAGAEAPPGQPLGMLVFDVELVSFKKAPKPPAAPKEVGEIPANATRSDSGLAWRVLQEGTGTEHPVVTSVVEITYTMWTADGEVVESSVLRGGPDTLGISQLVPGWTEAMQLMVEGERRLIWIPENIAYQGAPHRPLGMLVVDVTMVQIRRELHQVR